MKEIGLKGCVSLPLLHICHWSCNTSIQGTTVTFPAPPPPLLPNTISLPPEMVNGSSVSILSGLARVWCILGPRLQRVRLQQTSAYNEQFPLHLFRTYDVLAITRANGKEQEQECIPVGCILSAAVAMSIPACTGQGWWGVSQHALGRGGLSAQSGVSAQGCPPGGCLPRRRVYVSQHALKQTPPPPVNRITDRCKNITFPQLRLRTVITRTSY